MLRRQKLPKADCELVEPVLPRQVRGRKRIDDRRTLNEITRKLRTGDLAGASEWFAP